MEYSALSATAVKKQTSWPTVVLITAGGFILALLLAAFAGWLWFRSSQVILPGASVGGLDVGGLQSPAAALYLDQALNQARTIIVIGRDASLDASWVG